MFLDEAAPPLAWAAINGTRVFSRDEEERVVLEARIAMRFLDDEPRRRAYLEIIGERLAKRGFS